MPRTARLIAFLSSFLLIPPAAAAAAQAAAVAPPPAAVQPQPRSVADILGFGADGLNLVAIDRQAKPGDDFYAYANGRWISALRGIQAIGSGEDSSFNLHSLISEEVDDQVRDIIEHPADDPAGRQVAALYRSFTDDARIEQLGVAPIRPFLDRIARIRGRAELIRVFADNGYAMPVDMGVIPDPGDPSHYVLTITQAGLTMPSRDHYLRQGPEFDAYRAAMRTYAATLFRLTGSDAAAADAKAGRVMELERRLAETQWEPERSRDVRATYNPTDVAGLQRLAPQLDWPRYLPALGFGAARRFVVREPSAVAAAARLLDEVPLESWRDWLAFRFINSFADDLPAAFQLASFRFNGQAMYGQNAPHPRWSRGVDLVNNTLGETVGGIYLTRHFPDRSRAVLTEMVGNIRAAFTERFNQAAWMDDATRREALAKLNDVTAQIGGPTTPLDLTSVDIRSDDLVGNILRLSVWGLNRDARRLNQPVDRSEWPMTAQAVGASYNSLTNQITFPAGILQRPLFDPSYDPAVNYGRIGSAIGHELGHGFDDQGRRYDRHGLLRDWWSSAAAARFEDRARMLGSQYGQYEPVPGFRVNAAVTMGENIGDLGGLEIAFAAYRRHVAQHGEPPVVNGLTGDQRFFLAFAQTWAGHVSDTLMRNIVLTDEHSPAIFRVNGVVRNMDAWYRAFNIQPGDRMYLPPEQRVHIWG